MMMKIIIPVILLTSVTGCQLINTPRLQVSAVEFKNQSANDLHQVTLSVAKTHGRVSCSVVDAYNSCGTGFPSKGYSGEELTISWTNQLNRAFTQQLIVPKPTDFESTSLYKLTLLLTESGQVESTLNSVDY